ncbi:MAG TPA: hypothetical protein DEB06_00100, partial [Phycisphaerales bacterium]|nr:hypothetical protein [Phycisphaerales bacterium]
MPEPRHTAPHEFSIQQRVYLWLSGLFVTALLAANVIGVKLFRFDIPLGDGRTLPVEHTAGMLAFPITFLLTDLLNEYYGQRGARRAVAIAFVMGAVAFVLISIARALPILEGIPGTATGASFENIFGSAALMYLASLGAFLVGSLLDIVLFGVAKRLTGGRMVWLRATGSTVVSQLVDSFVVTILFFQVAQSLTGGESAPFSFVVRTALTGYILKFVIAVALTPVIYLGRWVMSRWFGLTPLPPAGLVGGVSPPA